MNRKLINVVKGDINTALENGNYNRNTTYQTNIEFNTPTKLILLDGIPYSSPLLTKVTWQELKNKRDASELIPGSLYRITDYQCTTVQENTRSAGHQFDIVLLALSENKLAEEGWAMMHDNIYDVTFSDGVTKKCYFYPFMQQNVQVLNVVDYETLLGLDAPYVSDFVINEEEKTATSEDWSSTDLVEQNQSYNYFQNSNLSAWKVWYCLDNDKSRFAWADDSVDEDSPAMVGNLPRYPDGDKEIDNVQYYCWGSKSGSITINRFTTSQTPNVGDALYKILRDVILDSTVTSYTPAHEGTNLPNGRGVIYRLIDEWNNDCPYDFKNIQFVRPMTGGAYDPDSGEDAWVYTFNTNIENVDSSNMGRYTCYSNYITPDSINNVLTLPNNVLLILNGSGINVINSKDCTVIGDSVTLNTCTNCIVGTYYGTLICCDNFRVYEDDEGIYILNKKVLTES